MTFGFHPAPKAQRSRLTPKRSVRGKITREQYNLAADNHGYKCYVCETTQNLEAHHVRFRSRSGRGQWRNIRFLCTEHHKGRYSPHENRALRRELEELHESLYGEWYWADEHDLFIARKIKSPSKEEFERFMQEEQRYAYFRRIDTENGENYWF